MFVSLGSMVGLVGPHGRAVAACRIFVGPVGVLVVPAGAMVLLVGVMVGLVGTIVGHMRVTARHIGAIAGSVSINGACGGNAGSL